MSQATHTPGPWRVALESFRQFEIIDSKGKVTCDTIASDILSDDEHLANAHLIAAAPEMLEALELLTELKTKVFYQSLPDHHKAAFDRAVAPAEAAITKAKGGQQ